MQFHLKVIDVTETSHNNYKMGVGNRNTSFGVIINFITCMIVSVQQGIVSFIHPRTEMSFCTPVSAGEKKEEH